MKRKIELLAPGGDVDSIKAAIAAGADAVYCGLENFNARNRATNIGFADLNGIIHLAHRNNCKVFLALNIIIVGDEIPTLIRLLNKLVNTRIDGVIVQDLGLFYLLSRYFKGLEIHASTQLTTHNEGQIKFLHKLGAARVNLSRELNLAEIKALTSVGHQNDIQVEVFVHGSYCISFSGLCYMSSFLGGKSGNRGRCSQPCRDRYLTTPAGKKFPLNLKDNSAYFNLGELYDAGVDSIKIEGRKKKFDYVYTVVNCWKKQIRSFCNQGVLNDDNSDLYKVFNRDFSNAYLRGDLNKNLFIDNPRDHSIKQFSGITSDSTNRELLREKRAYYAGKAKNSAIATEKIKQLSIAKAPLVLSISGTLDTPLKVSVKTPDTSFDVFSKLTLVEAGTYNPDQHNTSCCGAVKPLVLGSDDLAGGERRKTAACLSYDNFLERFKALNDTEYYLDHLEMENLQDDLFLPFKELASIKKKIVFILNNAQEYVEPIDVPVVKKQRTLKIKPVLSVLISSQNDLHLCNTTSADIFFQLPNCPDYEKSGYGDFFCANRKLIPWFPAILIGENYTAAVELLRQVQPECIVTNNTGIAYEAWEMGIPWIAGPYLNIVNSFSLLCLKEKFNCYGSFISNEISKKQVKYIVSPENFRLYYSIYHPVLLMNSRQCLLFQVAGCKKDRMDEECLQNCTKSSAITSLKNVPLRIEKEKGSYHCIYSNNNCLNTDIVADMPDTFSSFFIDLRDVKTETHVKVDKIGIIKLFENFLQGNPDSAKELKQMMYLTTNAQYTKGI